MTLVLAMFKELSYIQVNDWITPLHHKTTKYKYPKQQQQQQTNLKTIKALNQGNIASDLGKPILQF